MKEEKTVQQVAKQLGITPQAIYRRIKDTSDKELYRNLNNEVKTITNGNRSFKVITEKGIKLLSEVFHKEPEKDQPESPKDEIQPLYAAMEETIKALREQLNVKDQQIQELNERLKEQQQLNKNNQVLLLNEQERGNAKALESPGKWERVKGFFSGTNSEK